MAPDNSLSNVGDECLYSKECKDSMVCYDADPPMQVGYCRNQ